MGQSLYPFVAVVILFLGPPRDCQAQWHHAAEEPWQSSFTADTVALLAKICNLSEGQEANADRILTEHKARFSAFAEKGRAIETRLVKAERDVQMSSVRWWEAKQERFDTLKEFADEQQRIIERDVESLREMLSTSQLEQWPHFIDTWTISTLQRYAVAEFSEERIDLLEILDELEVEVEAADQRKYEVLRHAYTAQMAEALRNRQVLLVERVRSELARERARIVVAGDMVGLGPAPGWQEEHQAWLSKVKQSHMRIRSINRLYLQAYCGLLDKAAAECIVAEYERQRIPPLWTPARMPGMRYLAAVEARTDLSAEQRRAVDRIAAEYFASLGALNRQVAGADDAWADSRFHFDKDQAIDREKKYRNALWRRYEHENALIDQLQSVLTIAQLTDSPPPARLTRHWEKEDPYRNPERYQRNRGAAQDRQDGEDD